jgi:hypothetical protein
VALGYYYRGVRRARVDQERGCVCVHSAGWPQIRAAGPDFVLPAAARDEKYKQDLDDHRRRLAKTRRCVFLVGVSCCSGYPAYFHFYFGCAQRRLCCHDAAAIKTFPLARNIKLLLHGVD